LLKSIGSTTTDELPKIAQQLTDILIEALKIATLGPVFATPSPGDARVATRRAGPPAAPPPPTGNCRNMYRPGDSDLTMGYVRTLPALKDKPATFEFIFDPSRLEEVAALNEQLCRRGAEIEVRVQRPAGSHALDTEVKQFASLESEVNPPHTSPKPYPAPLKFDGLLYRRPLPYEIRLHKKLFVAYPGQEPHEYEDVVIKAVSVDLPNRGPIASLPIEWGACIEATYKVTFENGIPIKQEIDRPSEVVGCLDIPLNIVRSIVRLPTELIQLRVNYDTKQEELVKAQTKLIEALKAKRDAERTLNESPE